MGGLSVHADVSISSPRDVTRAVIAALCERGELRAAALPDSCSLPRTYWQSRQLRIFRVYARPAPERGLKARLAADIGVSAFELARQFRLAQGMFLEVYYVVGVLGPPGALRSRTVLHQCLDLYDGISRPRQLKGGGHSYWRELASVDRLGTTQRALLRAAATTLTGEDLGVINASVLRSWPSGVVIDPTAALSAARRLSNTRGDRDGPRPTLSEFVEELRDAETQYRRLADRTIDRLLSKAEQRPGRSEVRR